MRKILNRGFVKLEGVLGTGENLVFQFHVKAPVFVAKQWYTKGGSVQETEIGDDFYVPSTFSKTEGEFSESEHNALFTKMENYSKWSHNFYRKLIAEGLSVEQARLILPMNLYVYFTWTVRASELVSFLQSNVNSSMEIKLYCAALQEYLTEKLRK